MLCYVECLEWLVNLVYLVLMAIFTSWWHWGLHRLFTNWFIYLVDLKLHLYRLWLGGYRERCPFLQHGLPQFDNMAVFYAGWALERATGEWHIPWTPISFSGAGRTNIPSSPPILPGDWTKLLCAENSSLSFPFWGLLTNKFLTWCKLKVLPISFSQRPFTGFCTTYTFGIWLNLLFCVARFKTIILVAQEISKPHGIKLAT